MADSRYSNISPEGLDGSMDVLEPSMPQDARKRALVSWIMDKVATWRDYRDENFKDKWEEYYRLWRGVWLEMDKSRQSERSKLISPALQQAIEAVVAELEEATFGKGRWFEVDTTINSQQQDDAPHDVQLIQDTLLEDFNKAKVSSAVSEVYLNGAIFGTGIGKIIVEEVEETQLVQSVKQIGDSGVAYPDVKKTVRFQVRLEPISPRHFVIDPSARNIEEALGCAHEMIKPAHSVLLKQEQGIYYDLNVGSWSGNDDVYGLGEFADNRDATDKIFITEYHGLVPKNLLASNYDEDDTDSVSSIEEDQESAGLVEAIITIANEEYLLKETENPLLKRDRSFIAYQHDTVPNRFWGRGIAEKGYSPQKALDAELRARIDGLALTVHPMMAGDVTRMPRGADFRVRPGRQIGVNGNPKEVLMPLNFGTIDPNTFRNAADLERMIQMGTGAFDSAAPLDVNARNNTASGMSMIMSGAIKRSKRTMANIDRSFLRPFVNKALWRYIQFDPDRYPVKEYNFVITSTMGIMAREFEHAQLTQLLQTVPPASPAYWIVLLTIFENSSVSNKDMMTQVIQKMLQSSMNPQPPQPTVKEQLDGAKLQETHRHNVVNEKIDAAKTQAQIVWDTAKAFQDASGGNN